MNYDDFDQREKLEQSRRRARNEAQRKKQRQKLMIKRATIIIVMLAILGLVVFLLITLGKAIFAPKENAATPDESLVTATEAAKPEIVFNTPEIPDDKKTTGNYSSNNGGVYIYNKTAFELFGGSEDSAQYYADAISEFKQKAGDDITVYNMVVPNHTEFGLPRRLIEDGTVSTQVQADNIKEIYNRYSADVVPINCYNKLSEHVKDYIYFNTDHHWTGLGAYYAYSAFCEQTDQKMLNLDVCTEHTIEGFEGSLIDNDASLRDNLDTVHFWTFPYETYAMRTDNMGEQPYETSVLYEEEGSGPYSYGVFIWGDGPLFVEYNKDLSNGKKIAIVKESYGNAMAPFFTANYEETHVIDFRYYSGSLAEYCKDNGINEVLFINNVMAANTAMQVDRIRSIF